MINSIVQGIIIGLIFGYIGAKFAIITSKMDKRWYYELWNYK